jgi:hypothetical protein
VTFSVSGEVLAENFVIGRDTDDKVACYWCRYDVVD